MQDIFSKLVAARPLDDAEDPAAVMHARVDRWASTAAPGRRLVPDLVAGMIPRARGVSDKDMARALQERDEAMARRARELALKAAARGEAWITQLGAAPTDPVRREMWLAALSTLAAYRDRWKIGEEHGPLGLSAELMSKEQTRHRDRALVAIHTARRLSRGQSEPSTPTRPDARTELTSERPGSIAM